MRYKWNVNRLRRYGSLPRKLLLEEYNKLRVNCYKEDRYYRCNHRIIIECKYIFNMLKWVKT